MTAKPRAELKAENSTDFPNNQTRLISPADLRGQLDDIIDSALFPGDPLTTGPQGETGITASSVHYMNAAAIEGANVEVGVNLIETLSYAMPADGGSGIYRRVTGPADIQSLDGAWWELVPQGPLRTAALGVVGDASSAGGDVWSGTDQSPKINDALYRHVYENKGAPVVLPIGMVFLERGIHIGYGTSFRGGSLSGAGGGILVNDWPVTNILWNFTDEPALSVQGGRGIRIANMSFAGLNADYQETLAFGRSSYAGVADDTLLSTWMRPTWDAQASSRYAPAAAIAIDPRTFPADATYHYRDVDYPPALGAVSQYSKLPTSEVTIENVSFYGCGVCAVVVHPNKDSDGNGDFVRLKSCHIYGVPVGVSLGQTQARLTLLDSVDMAVCHTAITTRLHGKQNGVFTEAWNCCFSGIQIFDFQDTGVAGNITINGYGEELWRLGDVYSYTSSSTKLILNNCKLDFANQSDSSGNRGVPATMIGGGGFMPIEINGGSWSNYYGCAVIDHNCSAITIDGLLLQPREPTTLQEKCAMNGLAGGLVFPRLAFDHDIGEIHPKFVPWNLDTGAAGIASMIGKRWRSSRLICTPLWVEQHCATNSAREEGIFIPQRIFAIDIASFWTSPSLVNLVLTVTWPAWGITNDTIYGALPGDVLLLDESKTVFVCMTRVGAVATFKQLNNYRGLVARSTINITSGSAWLGNLRCYSPANPIHGIITSGSAVITDAGSVAHGGGTQIATQLSPDIAVNDYLVVDPSLVPYLDQNLCRVTAIDETAKTITLSGNATGSSTTRVRLGTFIRTPV